MKCGYCNWFISGDSKRSGDTIVRKCIPRHSEVDFNHKICKYFDPSETFFCQKHSQRIPLPICLVRRRNLQGFNAYLSCKRCRQFDQEIKELISKYYMECWKVEKFQSENPVRKIKRHKKTGRVLKRRHKKHISGKQSQDDRSLEGWANIILKRKSKKPGRKIRRRSK